MALAESEDLLALNVGDLLAQSWVVLVQLKGFHDGGRVSVKLVHLVQRYASLLARVKIQVVFWGLWLLEAVVVTVYWLLHLLW